MRLRSSLSRLRWSSKEARSKRPVWRSAGLLTSPWRDLSAEAALRGQPADQATFSGAADLALRDAKGFEHNAYKIGVARRAIVRALTQAAAGTPQSQSNKKIR
jgi:xanthine dehydrogenase YagS FAD-binding subunit